MRETSLAPLEPDTISFSEFLSVLIYSLDNEGVRFCALRNYEGFPVNNIGRDLDLLIHRSELPLAVRALGSIQGIRIVGYAERHYVATVFLAGVSVVPKARALQVDFYLDLTWKGLPYLTTSSVLQSAVPRHAGNSTFFSPAPVHEAIVSLFGGLLLGRSLKEKYFPQVQRTFASDRSAAIAALLPQFGLKTATRLTDAVIDGGRQKVLACVWPLRASLAPRSLLRRPFRSAQNIVRHHALEFAARCTPQDLETVYILGAGVCNKTNIIEGLMPTLQALSVLVEKRDSGPRLPIEPQLSATTSSVDSQAQTEGSSFVPMMKVVSWLLKEWVSQFVGKVLPTLRICESSYYDLLVDPNNYSFAGRRWLARLVGKLLPSGDLWILLDPAPDGSQYISEEVQPAETLRQLKAYRFFVKTRRSHVILDASKPTARIIEDAYSAIIDTLARRADRRLKSRF
jgi:hypothetical protein